MKLKRLAISVIVVGLFISSGCGESVSPTSNESGPSTASFSGPTGQPFDQSSGKADTFTPQSEPVAYADLSVEDAAVYLMSLGDGKATTEIVRTLGGDVTRVPVYEISRAHGLALVSRAGHMMSLNDLALSKQSRQRLIGHELEPVTSGDVWRQAEYNTLIDYGSETTRLEKTRELPMGQKVDVLAGTINLEHGTWFITEFGENISWIDARDVRIRGKRVLDSRYAEDRIEMAKIIQYRFPNPARGLPTPWSGHPHGGVEAMHEWQKKDRLNIDSLGREHGWWANGNHTMSVWSFRSAKQRYPSKLSGIELIRRKGPRFNMPEKTSDKWKAYFQTLTKAQRLNRNGQLNLLELEQWARKIQETFWAAQRSSLSHAYERNMDLFAQLPKAEQQFIEAWMRTAIKFLSAANFPSGKLLVTFNTKMFPNKTLKGETIAADKNDQLNVLQEQYLKRLWDLHRFEEKNGRPLLAMVKKAISALNQVGHPAEAIEAMETIFVKYHDRSVVEIIRDLVACQLTGFSCKESGS